MAPGEAGAYTAVVSRHAVPFLLLLVALCGCRQGCKEPPSSSPEQSAKKSAKERVNLDVSALPLSPGLPDVLRTKSGARVKTAADWSRRRQEIIELLLHYQYGRMPPSPGNVVAKELTSEVVFDGLAEKKLLALTMGPGGQVRATVGLYVPRAAGPRPTILHIDHRKVFGISAARQLVQRGYLVAGYDPTYLDPDQKASPGPAQAAYPKYDWGTLAVWAWGAMRVTDYLLTLPGVDPKKIVVAGHSRSGKTALLAGALDERFALVVPLGSGCGGAAAYRVKSPRAESLAQVTVNFPHWFHQRLSAFAGQEGRLPFDQHFVLALVAPRALLSVDALGDAWANLPGTQRAHLAVREVYALLGASARLGIHFREGKHELSRDDWLTLADFADRVFSGKSATGGRDWQKLPFKTTP